MAIKCPLCERCYSSTLGFSRHLVYDHRYSHVAAAELALGDEDFRAAHTAEQLELIELERRAGILDVPQH